MRWTEFDHRCMERALVLAERGQGFVEPNPMVGCVIARDHRIVGEGWHTAFGAPHAEVEALDKAGNLAAGATMYVVLEPCCHEGKTPPCTRAIIAAGVRRVVAAAIDPFPLVQGRGRAELTAAGIQVDLGLLEERAVELNAPFFKLICENCPWIIAKWAMTLDGKIATRTGDSQWISGEASRHVVHTLRGRVDAVLVGKNTALRDDPMLTARPPGPRTATRVVLDTRCELPVTHQLAQTARDWPTLLFCGPDSPTEKISELSAAGCEVFMCGSTSRQRMMEEVLVELTGRRMTNVLVEGGGGVLGTLFEMDQIDEVHVFIAPLLAGGGEAVTPIAGQGAESIAEAVRLDRLTRERLGDDLYVHGRVRRRSARLQ